MYDNEFFFYEDRNFNQRKVKNKSKLTLFCIILVFVLALLIGLYLYNQKIQYNNSYQHLEDRLEEEARKYVKNNNLESQVAFYIDARKLNVSLKDKCYSMSGVLVEGNNYLPYLICKNYETKTDSNEDENIKLNGQEIMFLKKGNQYIEPGYQKLTDVSVKVNANVGMNEGVYEISYVISRNNAVINRVVRKIIVLDNEEILQLYPTLSLNGEEIEYIELNDDYTEKGIVAFDKIDGLINDIKITGEVNTKQVGEYNISYKVINSRGYVSVINRQVFVIENDTEILVNYTTSTSNITNDVVLITLAISGNHYSYTVLPNNEISYDKIIKYEAVKNGNYNFKIYKDDEIYEEKNILIENIDSDKPTGVCSGYFLENKSYITINASDSSGIDKYVIGNKEFRSNVITLDGELSKVNISVYDRNGNYSIISCQLEDRNPVTNACNDKTIYPGHKYVFTQEQKEKMAAMIYTEADGPNDLLGMKLVASHMCNYYEMLNKGKEWTGSGLHRLITTSNWYAEMTKNSKYNSSKAIALIAVEEIMEKGNRILPHYIDEFDWFPNDIRNPLSNREDYIQGVSTYLNKGGTRATFWCINYIEESKSGNIFGYTSKP